MMVMKRMMMAVVMVTSQRRTLVPALPRFSQIVSRHCAPPSRLVACAQDGQRVLLKGYAGVVRYRGETHFGAGEWVGVELDPQVASLAPIGKNDGSVQV